VSDNITRDNLINEEIATFAGGKWFGHHQEHHIGCTTWNEDGNKYPLRYQVEPVHQPRLLVVRLDRDELLHKTYGPPMTLVVDDFEYAGQSEVSVQVANGGVGEVEFTVTWGEDLPWLTVNTLSQGVDADETTDNRSGLVKDVIAVVLTCDRSKLTSELQTAELLISDGETKVKVLVSARLAPGEIPGIADSDPQSRVHLALPGDIFVIEAPGFASNSPSDDGATWQVVKLGGREGDAIRVEPKTANFTSPSAKETNGSSRNLGKGPEVSYKALIEKPGNYTIELWQVPTGAVVRGTPLEFTCTITGPNCETQTHVITAIPADVDAGNPAEPRWAIPVLDNIRKVAGEVELSAGVNEFTIGAIQPNLMIEKLLLYPTAQPPLPSYLGPAASPVMKG
jgi:DNA-directed RNA polymerase subunit H (RpoH/RPB5)